jgi:hypothetical protein
VLSDVHVQLLTAAVAYCGQNGVTVLVGSPWASR